MRKLLVTFSPITRHFYRQTYCLAYRISELEALLEKQQREVDHYKKQLQEAHNVAMFQQTLSVSPPRIGIATRPAPPQLPAKPATLTQPQPRMPGESLCPGLQHTFS